MITKISMEEPYKSKWKYGYLNINSDGRRTLTLYNSHKDRSSTQYARYLMAIKIGRFLKEDEHVDHKDDDKTNDDITNLQILSLHENNIKAHRKPDIKLVCPICNKNFSRTRTQLRGKLHKIKTNEITCGRSCGAKLGAIKKKLGA